jgi:hypothetical protein
MLATLNISSWSAKKYDKKATQQVNEANNAQGNAGRYNKALLAREALSRVQAVITAARAYHNTQSLPWLDDATRILPAIRYDVYKESMRKFRVDFESEVDSFVAGYDVLVDEARAILGDLFDLADYPDSQDIRAKFRFGVRIMPMPDSSDFRAQISDHQAAQIRADIERDTREQTKHAMNDAYMRIQGVVAKMVEKLEAYKPARRNSPAEGVFRDSLVTNVRDLVEILPAFNLTADPTFDALVARMESGLCHHPEDLREDEGLRINTAKVAQEILDSVAGYLA